MRSIELLVIAMLVSCSSAKPPLAPVVIPEATAACADLACIEANVGKVIDLEGTFAFPMDQKRKGKHHYRLNVADGTSVILYDKALRDKLTKERDGEHMTVRGIVYTTEIPDEYGIIARTADPYCVRLYDVR